MLGAMTHNENKFEGGIPPEWGQLAQLKELKCVACGLTGGLPSSLGNLSNLKQCELGDNRLEGTIPATLGSLSKLEKLDLGDNRLEGMRVAKARMTLEVLDVLALACAGEVPASLTNLTHLQAIYLNANQFTNLQQIASLLEGQLPECEIIT